MKDFTKIDIENEVISKSNSSMKWYIMILSSLALVIYFKTKYIKNSVLSIEFLSEFIIMIN